MVKAPYYSEDSSPEPNTDDPFGFLERFIRSQAKMGSRAPTAASMKVLNPRRHRLTFDFELDFVASIERGGFTKLGKKTVAHAFDDRFRKLELHGPTGYGAGIKVTSARISHEEDNSYVEEDTDITDERPVWVDEAETEHINIASPAYPIQGSYWEDDILRIFSSEPGEWNPIHGRDIGLHCELNQNTSLGVNISSGTEELPFRTIRNLAMILVMFAPKIDNMLARKMGRRTVLSDGEMDQMDEMDEEEQTYRSPTPPDSDPNHREFPRPRTIAGYILHNCHTTESVCDSLYALLRCLKPEHRQYFNVDFTSVVEDPDGSEGHTARGSTIEFRQSPGSFDPDFVTHWINFTCALVEFSGHIGLESLILFLGFSENGYGYIPETTDVKEEEEDDEEMDAKRRAKKRESKRRRLSDEFHCWDALDGHPTLQTMRDEEDPGPTRIESFYNVRPMASLFSAIVNVGILLQEETIEYWAEGLMRREPGSEVPEDPVVESVWREAMDTLSVDMDVDSGEGGVGNWLRGHAETEVETVGDEWDDVMEE